MVAVSAPVDTAAQPLPDRVICDQARLSRDARFDGLFFTAVRSTGIYCRPVCPAPAPKRENVTYYRHAAAAEAAGFRPCLRCRPELAPGSAPVPKGIASGWDGAAIAVMTSSCAAAGAARIRATAASPRDARRNECNAVMFGPPTASVAPDLKPLRPRVNRTPSWLLAL